MLDNPELNEQIEAVNQLTGLSRFVIEKDLYVTQAISIVSNMIDDVYELIFQGGTSLAKAHRIIERMSEDCDFRIRFKDPQDKMSKAVQRKLLREFRYGLIDRLRQAGFSIADSAISVRNQGHFMAIKAEYPSQYPLTAGIKPFLALEFFLGEVKTVPVDKPVTALIKQVLGDKVDYPKFSVKTITVIETAAEKWVALTRRIATSKYREHYRDASLVRHLYDLYQINRQVIFLMNLLRLPKKLF